eukprot:4068596-Amphidinium_carterae.1
MSSNRQVPQVGLTLGCGFAGASAESVPSAVAARPRNRNPKSKHCYRDNDRMHSDGFNFKGRLARVVMPTKFALLLWLLLRHRRPQGPGMLCYME